MKFLVSTALLATVAAALAQSTIDPAERFSYGANIGWINWKPDQPLPSGGAVTGEAVLSGKIYSANCGWIDLGDGTPTNGINYQNNAATDFGVNVAPSGLLTGFAYGANIGWINFEQTHGQPRIDLVTGEFAGYAWGANVGWINLGTGDLRTTKLECTDTDGDEIGDEWEQQEFGNLNAANGTSDFDKDGATDHAEYTALTNPKSPQSRLDITSIGPSPNLSAIYRISCAPTGPGRVYSLQAAADLQGFADVPGLVDFLADPGTSTQKDIPAAGNIAQRRFFRVIVEKPLQ